MTQKAQPPKRNRLAALALWCCATAISVVIAGAAAYQATAWRLGPLSLDAAAESSRLVLDRNGQLLRAYATPGGRWRLPVSAADVDQRYLAMLFAFEDRRFHDHGGVDYRAVARVFWETVRNGRPISGGSTLTMQLARLLDGAPTRSLSAKVGQIVRAHQLERAYSKREILELYLKIAPYGGNVEGVRAASLAYFGKEPRRLALHEAALLVALPQSPEARRPDRNPAAARRARDLVLDTAARAGIITTAEAAWAKTQPVPQSRRDFPALAPHLADRAIRDNPGEMVIRTTIDKALQEAAENIAARQAASLGPRLSIAIIAADHATGEVLAHVGSAGYFDESRLGFIDMTAAIRSPGSALKPFIYGIAFEEGLAHPSMLIEDRPARFGSYAPKNFDEQFRGTITVAEALQLSLNVPAVKMLAAIGPSKFAARFRRAGFAVDPPRNLTVALGGVGLTLEELTRLYAALGRGGQPVDLVYSPLARSEGAPAWSFDGAQRRALLSPAAAWHVTEILRNAPPPPAAPHGAVAFKTGTSYGYRDAWAAGYDGRYVVSVWTGRADATPTPGLLGIVSAAPALFDMFAKLSPNRAAFRGPPASAVIAATADLPPPLQRFRDMTAGSAETPSEAALRIAFPPDGAEIEIEPAPDGGLAAFPLRAEGGALPLTWLVDGAPLPPDPRRRQIMWTPTGKGFAQVTVIDAKGRSQRVTIRLR